MAKDKVTEDQINRLAEINRELSKRTRRTKEYIALEEEAISLKKAGVKLEKTMESIRGSEEGIQKRINSAIKDREGSIGSILKSVIKLDLASASELLNKRQVAEKTKELAQGQASIANSLKKDVIAGKLTVTDRQKILKIQDGIATGKIKENDIAGKLQGLSKKGLANSKLYGEGLKGQAKSQAGISNLISKSSGGLTGMAAKIGGVGAAFAFLFSIAQKFAGAVDAIGKQFGSLNVQSDEFKGNLMDSQMEVIGIGATMEDVVTTTSALAGEFGISATDAADLSAQVIYTAKAVGLTNEEAAKLSGILQTTSGLSAQQAEQLTEGAFQLAVANNVAPDAVMKDLAGSAEQFASFSKDGGDNLVKAAVQARALGLSLQDTAKISEGLLNFQDSITKEVEASVLIGRQLNLQKARELALNNDIEGAMRAVVDQLGSEQEFNKLNALQRKALADSIGVEVSQLAKMVTNSEKANAVAGETAKSFQDIIGKEAMSELTATMNELKVFGVAVAQTLGPPLMAIAKVVNFVLVPLGKMVAGISSGLRGIVGGASLDFTNAAGGSFGSKMNPRDSVMAANNTTSINNVTMNNGGNNGGGTNVQISSKMIKLGGGDLGLAVDAYTYPSNGQQGRTNFDSITGRV